MKENNEEKETVIFNLKNSSDKKILKIDEGFWDNVKYIFFHSTNLKIYFKNNKTHTFLHYWFYETVQDPNQEFTEKEKREFWEQENCEYCFVKDEEFLQWLYDQAKERDLIKYVY